jgi:hypothetical protein
VIAEHVNDRWIVAPPSSQPTPIRNVKGSLLYNSIRQIIASGHYDRYLEVAGEAFATTIRTVPSTMWIPIDLAIRHYRTVDAMCLPPDAIRKLAGAAVESLNGIFLQTVGRASRAMGADAATALRLAAKVWPRLYDRGAIAIERTGERSGTIHLHGLPLLRIPYFRLANGIYFRAVVKLLTDDVRIFEGTDDEARKVHRYTVQWR